MSTKNRVLMRVVWLTITLICVMVMAIGAIINCVTVASAASGYSLLYKLDFSDETNLGKNTGNTSFADAVLPDGNGFTIENGANGKKALNFVGGTKKKNFLSLPTNLFENQTAVTISGWFFLPTGIEAYLGEIGIYSPENDVTFRTDPFASYHEDAYIYNVGKVASGGNLDTNVKPVYDAWYHMTYVINADADKFTVYENGAKVLETQLAAEFSPSQYFSATSHFYLGQSAYSGYHDEGEHNDYKGKMSDIRVYSGALSKQELAKEYSFSIADFKTAEYTADTSADMFKDNIRGYNLKAFNGEPTYNNGAIAVTGGAAFQAFNKKAANTINPKFFDGHANFTISMDIKILTPSTDDWKRIMDMFISDDNRITYMAYCPRTGGKYMDIVYHKGGDNNLLGDKSFTPPNNQKFNLTIAFGGDKLRVYNNGTLAASATAPSGIPHFSQFIFDLTNSAEGNFSFAIPSYETNNSLNAEYDNIRMYAYAAQNELDVKAAMAGVQTHYSLEYNANGGAGESVFDYVEIATPSIAARANTFTLSAYEFAGWNTKPDGAGISYQPAATVSLTENLVLYAQWRKIARIVTFNANGGRGVMDNQAISAENTPITACGFIRQGYNFTGWNTVIDGTGIAYADEATITLSADSQLFAQWAAKSYVLSYNANGGAGEMTSSNLTFDTATSLPKNTFSRNGYMFDGWAYTSEGVAVFSDSQQINSVGEGENIQLFAVWKIATFELTFNSNGGEGVMSAITGDALSFVKIGKNTFTFAGKQFMGWADSANGAVVYADESDVPLFGDKTLFAVWETAIYELTFNSNGGEGVMSAITGDALSFVKIGKNTFTFAGKQFMGWADSANGAVVYADESDVALLGDKTLFAVWGDMPIIAPPKNDNNWIIIMVSIIGGLVLAAGIAVGAFFIIKKSKTGKN